MLMNQNNISEAEIMVSGYIYIYIYILDIANCCGGTEKWRYENVRCYSGARIGH